MEKKVLDILNLARNSIGEFCINECKAQCCRKGSIILNSEIEVNLMTQNKKEEYIKNEFLEQIDECKYKLHVGKKQCPNLSATFTCTIHKDENRPRLCKDFPLFKVNKFIITASMCPAVERNLMADDLKKLEELGYKII